MPDLVHDVALIRQRRNPARIAYRTYEIVQGEDVQLAVTVWNRDTDAQPVDVSNTMLWMALFRRDGCGDYGWDGCGSGWRYDYGWVRPAGCFPVAQVLGVLPGDRGRVDINLTRDVTICLGGRYQFLIYAANRPPVPPDSFLGSDFAAADFLADASAAATTTTILGQGILDVTGCSWAQPVLLLPVALLPPAPAALPVDFSGADFSGAGFLADPGGTGGTLLVAPVGALLGGDGMPLLGADYAFLLPP